MATATELAEYDEYIQHMRETEFPMLNDSLYLDHAGTTLYSKSLMDLFHTEMLANLYGNPHSMSPASQSSTQEIDSARLDALHLFGADPEHFDLVFTANTTAAIKLVMEAFRVQDGGFWYGYHVESHTSLVGVRESARSHKCFENDEAVHTWLAEDALGGSASCQLFAFPAQSNMNGRRLPLGWIKCCQGRRTLDRTYTLLDTAAYAATSPLLLSDADSAPDFTVVSFSKIFGFPDLGALIVKKNTSHLFRRRSYFGGGTVDMVLCSKEQWHALKTNSIHECLEDGTLPVHSIVALKAAMKTHQMLFHSFHRIAEHTSALIRHLHLSLGELRHANGEPVVRIYDTVNVASIDYSDRGPVIAFNLLDRKGQWVSNSEVEKLALVRKIHLRTGGLCNPGGVAKCLGLEPCEMRENYAAGFKCGTEDDIVNGKPTGVIRASLGAMSTRKDVEKFVAFVDEFFVDKTLASLELSAPVVVEASEPDHFYVERLVVYPIKSCGGWQVPYGQVWDIRAEGLAWDREWCVVKLGSGAALSQKAYPRMALIRPHLDLERGLLRIRTSESSDDLLVGLSDNPGDVDTGGFRDCDATVCGDSIQARAYTSPTIASFFTKAIGIPCTLARFPVATRECPSTRHSKAHLHASTTSPRQHAPPILLSNESPILTISRSSLNRLNETIKARGGRAVHCNVFRANIVVAENPFKSPGHERPWVEDKWRAMQIDGQRGPTLDFWGGCRRCQMVCINQENGEKDQEPLVTLSKTRRFDGRVLFGVHTSLNSGLERGTIKVGDKVRTWDQGGC